MLKGKNIVLGVTGGIAVYKAADLVSKLVKQHANVEVIMTEAATKFVSPLTFQTMSVNKVHTEMFGLVSHFDVEHISLAQKADVILIAPATANTIGKIACGIADNLLTTVVMASHAKIIYAPAMNTNMYNNPIFQENMNKLKQLGHEFIKTGVGRLACGDYGAGKMAEPSEIVDYLISSFVRKDFLGKKVVITAGPTIEPIDPVRYITNHSSGKMGYSLAKEALDRGAEVILITGPTSLTPPEGAEVVKVNTTQEMFDAVGVYFDDCDILIKSAAPLDYKPDKVSPIKIKKNDEEGDNLDLKFVRNPDIAAHYGKLKKDQIIVGFAAETNNVEEFATGKLKKKNFDFIVANDVTEPGAGFKNDTNIATIIDNHGNLDKHPLMGKKHLAKIIFDKIYDIMDTRGAR
ncbi:bifunctional phosphopantothenoylcysteine decarboxylase/phosphopantothenate--cysteine ligase CoaBC [Tissierella sp. Yu-01]|uniref:bifunctional phosphopantothenoylcysteine decarboxylase/phosphopantothenate--cysteine ligase CoaBC n=1 Tax=Tissierella sp. Yu-01 TaxID=3035694 RepID=UPI00240D9EAF|nr:bifunctional phosphopantothenoylcysteine decarboxylase/phosphopantothenate--cysteine ligase CoaBC [Tissierella sp. Yu-01]WFA09818.1 bifunctional phosphopantothenoylcysteine decarboxylase/phosphopantothenate--cysteine ligase CoaBC [Tissierella sp. Yu-01]